MSIGGVIVSSRIDWNKLESRLLLLLAAVAIAGCAGASVNPGVNSQPASSGRPSTIYVYPLAVSAQDVTLNQGWCSSFRRWDLLPAGLRGVLRCRVKTF
jgi:hypothetical protein